MKNNLRSHFTQNTSLESFDDESAVLGHTDAVASAYAEEQVLDGRDRELLEDQLKAAEADHETLANLASAVEGERDVGLEAGSAGFMQLTLASIQKRHGIDENVQTHAAMPSLECFDGRMARVATSLSLESVRNTQAIVKQTVDTLRARLATETN